MQLFFSRAWIASVARGQRTCTWVDGARVESPASFPSLPVSALSAASDPALEVLMSPFVRGDLAWPAGDVLFLRARDGWALRQFPLARLLCEQSFKPEADALARAGLKVVADAGATASAHGHALVLVLPPRQREESRALLARALSRVAPDGVVVACVPNPEGAKSAERDLAQLAGIDGSLSKHHCRVFWTSPASGRLDTALQADWQAMDAPRPILAGRFTSRPGVFAWDRIDPASALLVEHLPADLAGHGADLGAGYGYLSAELLARCPRVTALDLFEAEARALALAERNLAGARVPMRFHWHDVTTGLPERYDFIVTNPPFHAQGRAERPDIGQAFIAAAAAALKPAGRLWLVANRHLPYEQALGAGFARVRVAAERDGFKVIEAVKA